MISISLSVFRKLQLVVAVLLYAGTGLLGQTPDAEFVEGELLVKFKSDLQTQQVQSTLVDAGIQQLHLVSEIGVYHCSVANGARVQSAIEACRRDANVVYAEPNYIYRTSEMEFLPLFPGDPRFSELWGLQNGNDADIDAPEAWDIQTGNQDIIIGVIDTGVDYDHEDLQSNMWRNPGESGNGRELNGIDDDGNGFVDDVFGANFAGNDGDPRDDNGHGTHVAGTIGAAGNNGVGVAGVNWQVSIMALKFLDANGSGSTDNAISAIIYAVNHGAVITSNSWGGGGRSQALEDAIKFARDRGQLFVAAAGNSGVDTDRAANFPSNYNIDNIISVAASDRNDQLASFSNFGRKTVDLAAPGVNILSAQPGDRYQTLSGTSMATPHVSGVAGLVLSQFPGLGYREVLLRILGSVDPKTQFSVNTFTGGRLNAFNALSTSPLITVTPIANTTDTAGPYRVTAEVVDDGQITVMTLTYSINGGAENALAMQKVGPSEYGADIPGQALESNIEFFVSATDNDANVTESSHLAFRITEDSGDEPDGCFSFLFGLPDSDDSGAATAAMLLLVNLLVHLSLIWSVGRITLWWPRNLNPRGV